jgi:hypothetical protein
VLPANLDANMGSPSAGYNAGIPGQDPGKNPVSIDQKMTEHCSVSEWVYILQGQRVTHTAKRSKETLSGYGGKNWNCG